MLDIQYIRDHPKTVRRAVTSKNLNPKVVDNLLDIDQKRRQLIAQVEDLRSQRNQLNQQLKQKQTPKLITQSKSLKSKLQDLEPQLNQLEKSFQDLLLQIPNLPLKDVPIGKDSSDNKQVKTWGEKPTLDFEPKNHIEIGTSLGLFDLERGAKVAGFRGYYLTGDGVRLSLAIMLYALDKLSGKGFNLVMPPIINRRSAFINSGHFPWGESETYRLAQDETDPDSDYFLAGTAEVPLVSLYANEIFSEKDLPIKMVGFSPCYRREIGNYGKDTKGIFRVHEFLKAEQVIICKNDLEESLQWHEKLLSYAEEILQDLGLHYRVMLMCTGDMGEPQAKKYDIETWMPGRQDYGETASDSIMTDFQSRRANIRYQAADGTLKFAHMLNNTAAPSTRLLIAILENYQQADGTVKVPAPLVPYVGKDLLRRED